jgi:hypothetical protein
MYYAMTTLDSIQTTEDLMKEFGFSSRRRKIRSHFPAMALVHVCMMAGVAIFCLNLVH